MIIYMKIIDEGCVKQGWPTNAMNGGRLPMRNEPKYDDK